MAFFRGGFYGFVCYMALSGIGAGINYFFLLRGEGPIFDVVSILGMLVGIIVWILTIKHAVDDRREENRKRELARSELARKGEPVLEPLNLKRLKGENNSVGGISTMDMEYKEYLRHFTTRVGGVQGLSASDYALVKDKIHRAFLGRHVESYQRSRGVNDALFIAALDPEMLFAFGEDIADEVRDSNYIAKVNEKINEVIEIFRRAGVH